MEQNLDSIYDDSLDNLQEFNIPDTIYTFDDSEYKSLCDILINHRNKNEYHLINENKQNRAEIEFNRIHNNVNINPTVNLQANNPLSLLFPLMFTNLNSPIQNGTSNNSNSNINYFSFSVDPNEITYSSNAPLNANFSSGSLFDILDNLSNIVNNFNNQESVPVTLTNKAIDDLERVKYDDLKKIMDKTDSEEQCAICFGFVNPEKNENNEKDEFIILPCKHYFHSGCILEHLKNYDYHCPICRKECGEHQAKL
ncbi:Hypothetical protein KVN_LOCUS278 [uncultured virus]|nr:Hypothetical protein KVN_LOCUS278 [uncultured virus]